MATDRESLNVPPQTALSSRAVLEQAKGLFTQRGGLDMSDAFQFRHRYERDLDPSLTDVARAVVSRAPTAQHVLELGHAHVFRTGLTPS